MILDLMTAIKFPFHYSCEGYALTAVASTFWYWALHNTVKYSDGSAYSADLLYLVSCKTVSGGTKNLLVVVDQDNRSNIKDKEKTQTKHF